MMGDGKGDKGAPPKEDARRPGERLPKEAPDDIRRFVLCQTMRLELRGGKLDWLKIDYKGFGLQGPDVEFEQNPDGTVKATASKFGGAVSVSVTISVNANGEVTATVGGPLAPLAQGDVDKWVRDLNDDMKKHGRRIDGVKVERGGLVITKAGAPPAKPANRRRMKRRARLAAAALGALVVAGGAVALAGGTSDESNDAASDASAVSTAVAAETSLSGGEFHRDNVSKLILCLDGRRGDEYEIIVTKVEEGGRRYIDAVPKTINTVNEDGELRVEVDITGRGPGKYEVTGRNKTTGKSLPTTVVVVGVREGTGECAGQGD